jgi:hypothetical protein
VYAVAASPLQTSASGCLFQRQCAKDVFDKLPSAARQDPAPCLLLVEGHAMLVHRKKGQGRQRFTVRDLSFKN